MGRWSYLTRPGVHARTNDILATYTGHNRENAIHGRLGGDVKSVFGLVKKNR